MPALDMAACLTQPTRSDGGPWMTVWDEDEDQPHVMPAFGPRHTLSTNCWCHPVMDEQRYTVAGVVSHNVAQ